MSTDFLDSLFSKVPARQRQWHVENNVFEPVKCKTCQTKNVNWSVKNKRYSTYCSSKCAQADPTVRSKIERTCINKYGAKTNLSTDENKAKQRATCIAKYGVDNFAKTPEFVKKSKETFISKYGVDNPMKDPEIVKKIDKTHIHRYARKRASQAHIPSAVIELKNNAELMKHWFFDLKMPITAIAEELGVNHSQLCVHFKQNLGIDITRHRISYPETQLFNFVQSLCPDAEASNRTLIKPKELDIIIPSKRIAIEYNGLAWHGELRGNKGAEYHREKTKATAAAGYQLIHVLSNEWEEKQELVKSRIATKLGKGQRIYARQCTVKEIPHRQAAEFLDATHIQGACVAKVSIGLFHNDTLVAVMTFGKPRFNKKFEWELIRLSTALNTIVVGGASKLFAYFRKVCSPKSIISYCDCRWNTGNVYKQLRFDLERTTGPNYWYISQNRYLHNRMQFQKHKLASVLEQFDQNLTEWENMQANGFDRFWDCGNTVWAWRN